MYILIVNPIAGNGRGKKVFERLKKSPIYAELETIEYVTAYKGHASKIARELNTIEGAIEAVIVIGGDGTIHEVVNGLPENVPISFIPAGSGNDFYRGAQLPKKTNSILSNIVQGIKEQPYWFGRSESHEGVTFFVNCIGFGFDAYVVHRANRSTLKKGLNKIGLGTLIYVFSLVLELFFYKPFKVTIKIDETTKTFHRCFLLTINNQPYFGGGMKINPTTKNNPDYFSILVVDSISKWKVLFLFMTVFIGKHIHFEEVKIYSGKHISIETETPILYQIDGEIGEASHCSIKKQPFPLTVKGSE